MYRFSHGPKYMEKNRPKRGTVRSIHMAYFKKIQLEWDNFAIYWATLVQICLQGGEKKGPP